MLLLLSLNKLIIIKNKITKNFLIIFIKLSLINIDYIIIKYMTFDILDLQLNEKIENILLIKAHIFKIIIHII